MSTAEALVAQIAAATGQGDFPARIGTTAAALARTAEARFAEKSGDRQTLGICRTLAESRERQGINGFVAGLNAADAQVIAFFLAGNAVLSKLILYNNQIKDIGAVAISEALKTNTALRWLGLDNNQIGDAGAAAIGEALKTNAALSELGMRNNHIGDAGAAAIGEGLKTNVALSVLSLFNNQIGDAGAAAIGEALKTNATLSELNLGENQIGDAGAAAIGEALKTNAVLTELNSRNNQIGDAGAATIGEALKTNSTLSKLNLYNNPIADEGAAAIGEALETNAALSRLKARNPFSAAMRSAMEAAFAQRVQTLRANSDNAFTPPSADAIDANRVALQARDPLHAGDVVLRVREKGAPLFEVTAAASYGGGAYSLRAVAGDDAATYDGVPRWQLQPCSLADLLRFSEARWRSLRESTTPRRLLVRAFAGDAFPSAEAEACVARLWECVSLETVEVRPALAGSGPVAAVMARPAGWRTPWGRFARGERVRVKGSREMWRVEGVEGRAATLVGEEEGGEGAEARLEGVPFEEITVVGEWARVWHVADLGRARGTSAALRALSGTAESARTRGVVESYLGEA